MTQQTGLRLLVEILRSIQLHKLAPRVSSQYFTAVGGKMGAKIFKFKNFCFV